MMAVVNEAYLGNLDDDGFYTPRIKQHSVEKIRIHNYYLALFTTSMKARWPQRAYLGLYSGPGRARIESTGEIIETTAMSAFRPRFPFTKYIFVDNAPRCIEALEARIAALPDRHDVTVINADVAGAVPQIIQAMPAFRPGHGLLSFCFIDPFSAALDFQVIKSLGSRYKMDFLIILMLGRDVRTNFRHYFDDPTDTRIASLIDDLNWREEWRERGLRRRDLVRYLLEKFNNAMTRLGYKAALPGDAHPIRVMGKNVFLYSLVFYSKNDLGRQFWEATRKGADPQIRLDL
jgi:three-Cys-motif partner protein